tara:strand:- start:111 stop:2645 length:2535 start_codon:yes stop_codon:yes gene_type:complete
MAKTKISEYDATAANNTDIDSINIAEGMAPSNVNNAIREMMAHLKDMDAGTHALTSPQLSSVDINGGTIDGVTIGGASAGAGTFTNLTATGTTALSGTTFSGNVSFGDNNITNVGSLQVDDIAGDTDGNTFIAFPGSDVMTMHTGNVEAIRIDANQDATFAGSVGIGTSSPSRLAELHSTSNPALRLNNGTDVADIGLASSAGALLTGSTSGALVLARGGANAINLGTNGQNRLTIDSNGNVGISCIPNSSSSGVNGLSIGEGGSIPLGSLVSDSANNTETRLGHGYYHDGSNFKYETASIGVAIYQQLGNNSGAQHIWFSDAGGSEDATFTPTERMRINSNGRVGIGTSSPSSLLHISQASDSISSGLQIRNAADSSSLFIYQDGVNSKLDTGTSGDLTIDVAGDIILDADSGNWRFKDAGTAVLEIGRDSNTSVTLFSAFADMDMVFKGNDGGSTVTALTLDMSDAGKAIFNSQIQGESGAVSAPTFAFSNDSNTGMTRPTGDTLTLVTGGSERMRIDSNGHVSIGGTSTGMPFQVHHSDEGGMRLIAPDGAASFFEFGDASDSDIGRISYDHADNHMAFRTSNAERMRVDTDGKLLVGTTHNSLFNTSTQSHCGVLLDGANDNIQVARHEGTPAFFNRLSTDGALIDFRIDGTSVGSIGSRASGQGVTFNSQAADGVLQNGGSDSFGWNANYFYPRTDDNKDLGFTSLRWDDIFATNGTIQTSDRNEKQDIAELTETEMKVGKRISALFKTFRWKSKVTEKGDAARTHTGIIAQDVQAAFSAEGLDASKYALWCSDTWTNDDGSKQTRMGVRYPELLSFLSAYNEQRFTDIEARITALEGA